MIERNIPKTHPVAPYYSDMSYTNQFRANKEGNPQFKRYIRVIVWLRTPIRNNVSKYFASVKANLDIGKWKSKETTEVLALTKKQCIEYAKEVYKSELKKGYKVGEVFIHSANLN